MDRNKIIIRTSIIGIIANVLLAAFKAAIGLLSHSVAVVLDKEAHTLRADIVLSFDAKDPKALLRKVLEETQAAFPGWQVTLVPDRDISD